MSKEEELFSSVGLLQDEAEQVEPQTPEQTPEEPSETPVEETEGTPSETPSETEPEKEEEKEIDNEAAGTEPSVIKLRDIEPPAEVEDVKYDLGQFENPKDLLEAYKNLELDMKMLKEKDPFADEQMKALNDFVSKGGDISTYLKTQMVDPNSMSPIDMIILQETMSNPHTDASVIESIVRGRYQIKDDYEDDPAAKKEVEDRLAYDAGKAKQYLLDKKVENSIPQAERQRKASQMQEEQRAKNWEAPLSKTLDNVKAISIDLGGRTAEYPIEKSEMKGIESDLMNLVKDTRGFELNQANLDKIRNTAIGMYKAQNFDKIISALYNKMETGVKVDEFKAKHNPSASAPVEAKPDVEQVVTPDDLANQILRAEGLVM